MFRLQESAKSWFKDVRKDLSLDFDIYYFCLMAGLANCKKSDISHSDAKDLVNDFPGAYRAKGRIIIALFLSRELKSLGISFSERNLLHSAISELIDTESSARLSDLGFREINKYSYGGFDVLTEHFEDRPRTLETFLPMYKKFIDNSVV